MGESDQGSRHPARVAAPGAQRLFAPSPRETRTRRLISQARAPKVNSKPTNVLGESWLPQLLPTPF